MLITGFLVGQLLPVSLGRRRPVGNFRIVFLYGFGKDLVENIIVGFLESLPLPGVYFSGHPQLYQAMRFSLFPHQIAMQG